MLDDHERAASLEQFPERRQQLRDVVEVQARGRFVENVEQPLSAARRQVRRDLDTLRLASRERRGRLAEPDVAEADLVEHLQAAQHLHRAAEELQRLAHCEVQDLGDVAALVLHVEHRRLETLAVAVFARHVHVGEELHLDLHLALALARLAAATGHVEREGTGREPAAAGVLGRGEQFADRIERLEIGDGIRPRRAADGRLVDQHDVREQLRALEATEEPDLLVPVALGALDPGVEYVVHERRLARAADAGDAGQRVERELEVDVLQVVLAGADDPDLLRRALAAVRRHRDLQFAAQVFGRERSRLGREVGQRAVEDHPPAVLAGAEAHVDDVIGHGDHVGVVLDDQDGVALVAQLPQDRDEPLVVAGMQADRRLVEHVQRADQRRAERRRQADALRFPPRQGRRQAVEREVVEADVGEEAEAPADLDQHLVGDRGLLRAQCQRVEELLGLARGQRRDPVDRLAADPHGACLASQPRALAVGARLVAAVTAQEHPDVHLVFLPLEPREEAAHPLPVAAVALDDEAPFLGGQITPGHVEAQAEALRDLLQLGEVGAVVRLGPRLDGALRQRLRLVGHDQRGVEFDDVAEAVARRAGAERVVEREQARLRRLIRQAAGAALEALAEHQRGVGLAVLAEPTRPRRAAALLIGDFH